MPAPKVLKLFGQLTVQLLCGLRPFLLEKPFAQKIFEKRMKLRPARIRYPK